MARARGLGVVVLWCAAACGGGGTAANGTIATWSSSTLDAAALPPLPKPRANHCTAAANGRLYVLGGNYKPAGSSTFVSLDDVEVADQRPASGSNKDGSLGAWRLAGSLPGTITGCTATSDGKRLYLVGGLFETESLRGHVWTATIQPDGMVATFVDAGALPAGHTIVSTQAFVRDDVLFVFDSTLSVDGTAPEGIVLLHAPIDAGATLGAWTEDRGPAGFRGRPQYAATDRFVYAMGGYLGGSQGNTVVADGFGAPFDGKTGMGASFDAGALPEPRAFGAGAAVDDFVFVLGGKTAIFNGEGRPEVYAAKADGSTGKLGAFAAVGAMPEGRTNMDAAVLGDFLYVTGGGTTGGGLDNVFAARVRY